MSRPKRLSTHNYVGIARYFLTFCTFGRVQAFEDLEVATRTLDQFRRTAALEQFAIRAYCLMPDHVHLFVKHDAKSSASYVANQFKGFTSRVLREEFPHLKSRMPTLWSSSYFAASVGAVSAATVEKYVNTQWERPWKKGDGS